MPTTARKCSALRSWRRCRRRQPASQESVLSTPQRWRPGRVEDSAPLRATRWRMPRLRSHRRGWSQSYPLSACGLAGGGAVGRAGSGSAGCRVPAAAGRGCHACSRPRRPATGAERSGPWPGGFSIRSCRGRPDSVRSAAPPFFAARTLMESIAHRDRSSSPLAPSSSRTTRWRLAQPLARLHRAKRRQTVGQAAEHRRQLPPGAAGGGHEDNRRQAFTVTRPPGVPGRSVWPLRVPA